MADGYARATRSLGVLNLHVAPGLGNGMGALYTAGVAQTPLLALVGGQDRRFLHTEPILWGPVEKMASAVTKAVFGLNSRYDAEFNIPLRAAKRSHGSICSGCADLSSGSPRTGDRGKLGCCESTSTRRNIRSICSRLRTLAHESKESSVHKR